jgi:ABC-type uncharacterized transport system involved in gliding motility auxiliary subunit
MGKTLQISGFVGLILFLFGIVALLFTRNIGDYYVLTHLVVGLILLLVYIFSRGTLLFGSLKRRSTRHGIHSLSYSLIFLGILVMLNYLGASHTYRWDLSENKIFSLSPQSIKVIGDLKKDLEIFAFFQRGNNRGISNRIKSYTYLSPRIKFRVIDPDRNPEMAKRFKIRNFNTLHLRYGDNSTNLTETTEEAVTNAIIKLARLGKKVVYFVTGHGEPKINDRNNNQGYASAKEALENENYQVKELLLPAAGKIPDDASMVIIPGPQKPLLDHEIQAIKDHVKKGKGLFVLLPPPENDFLNEFLRDWGIQVGNDLVIDQVIRLFSGPSIGVRPISNTYSPTHPITRDLRERTIYPLVRSVTPADTIKKGLELTSLVQTGPSSWAESNVDEVFKQGKASLGADDKKGPISIAVATTVKLKNIGVDKEGAAKIVVLGTAGFANNRFIRILFNRDLFINISNWLVGQEEFISIRPRSLRSSRLQLTKNEGSVIFYLSFLILPEILLIVGIGVWWKRR